MRPYPWVIILSHYMFSVLFIEVMVWVDQPMRLIADILGISTRTLRRHRHQLGLPIGQDIFHQLSDSEIDEQVIAILQVSLIVESMCTPWNT